MSRESKIPIVEQYKGSVYDYNIVAKLVESRLDVTISSVEVSTLDNDIIVLGDYSYSAQVLSLPVTAKNRGNGIIKLLFNTTGVDKPVFYLEISVLDPECSNGR